MWVQNMVFSSLIFLFGFFSISMAAYALCRTRKAQNAVLLVFSLIFYAWGEPVYVLLLMFMALTSWFFALCVEATEEKSKKKIWVAVSAVIDLLLIGWFKYSGLICSIVGVVPEFIQNIALPIGISFYTFQLLSYVVDVYRGDAAAQKSYWNVLLYAALFHQCVAGPIVRYKTIDQELFQSEKRQPQLHAGVIRFCLGLAKKVLIANPLGAFANSLILSDALIADTAKLAENLTHLQGLSVLGAWAGVIGYSLHIYFDFSAYSDMAIGMGKMIGLNYLENFDHPYVSRSVTEFWRRWHMSLGTFFRDYVYIPLGGSRCSTPRMVFNTLVVWFLTGIWHGASWNFALWGLWFFAFLMLERFFLKKYLDRLPILSHLYLTLVVLLGWVIFRFTDISLGFELFRSMFGLNGNPLSDFTSRVLIQGSLYLLIAAGIACTPVPRRICQFLEKQFRRSTVWGNVWDEVYYSILPVVILLLCTACLVGNSYNPFIYFQF